MTIDAIAARGRRYAVNGEERKKPRRERIFSQIYSVCREMRGAQYPLLGGKRKMSDRREAGGEAREAGRIDGSDSRAIPISSARKVRVVSLSFPRLLSP
jgi:hypothetical protein